MISNGSAGIPSLPLVLFIVMLPKAHLTSHSRMSGSRRVMTPSWLSLPPVQCYELPSTVLQALFLSDLIPYNYTVEITNRFKGLDLIERAPEELWMEVHNIAQEEVITMMVSSLA